MVVDSNVISVAEGKSPQADSKCVSSCIDFLQLIAAEGVMILDDCYRILSEYDRQLHGGQPGPGSAFLKWLYRNQANLTFCRQVTITPRDTNDFEEFPDDSDLADFDPSDRKFVAVAIASVVAPPIVNAVDSDWRHSLEALSRYVAVEFLCPHIV